MAIKKSRMQDYYRAWKKVGTRSLFDVYKSYSWEKAKAWRNCVSDEIQHDGRGLSVITKNTSVFTAGFVYDSPNGQVFRVITPTSYGEICVGDCQNEIF